MGMLSYQADDRIDSFFAHHGIKGQKWGVRRFQNADGSLTTVGRARYLKGGDKETPKAEKEQERQLEMYRKYQDIRDKELKPLQKEASALLSKRQRLDDEEKRLVEILKVLNNQYEYMRKKYPALAKNYEELEKKYDLDALDDAGEFVELSHKDMRGVCKMTYKGVDKVDDFFMHYGRKGMKRGMNIFNSNYKPIGEKAKGAMTGDLRYSKPKTSAMTGDPRYSKPKTSAMTGDPRYTAPKKSAADGHREALLNAEKNRYSFSNMAKQENDKKVTKTKEEIGTARKKAEEAKKALTNFVNNMKAKYPELNDEGELKSPFMYGLGSVTPEASLWVPKVLDSMLDEDRNLGEQLLDNYTKAIEEYSEKVHKYKG